ncbi:hypothetical protein SAMN05661093_07159 [Kibdelosporangium aridum]|uniref:Uncharacterized protein n=1 Tax=Kibdelosporangium aridum TaxID=2030 RepID=A0A1Y5XYN5_KIBAR|nr:hypothetical protein SAMN05661093_07159 [Kibdelosporangium aridum]
MSLGIRLSMFFEALLASVSGQLRNMASIRAQSDAAHQVLVLPRFRDAVQHALAQ